MLKDYSLINLSANYKIQSDYKLNFSIKNLLDEKYNEANNYNTPRRSYNIKLGKKF
jgi:outer membrane cobalamin receptor